MTDGKVLSVLLLFVVLAYGAGHPGLFWFVSALVAFSVGSISRALAHRREPEEES